MIFDHPDLSESYAYTVLHSILRNTHHTATTTPSMPTQEYARFAGCAGIRSALSFQPYYISIVPTVIVLLGFVNVQLNIHSLWGVCRQDSGDEKGGSGANSRAKEKVDDGRR
jgi:hypothetical protein